MNENKAKIREALKVAMGFVDAPADGSTQAQRTQILEALALLDEDKPSPEPATAEQGEWAFPFEIQTWKRGDKFNPNKIYCLSGEDILSALAQLLADRPQPESAAYFSELADRIETTYHNPLIKPKDRPTEAAALIQSTFECWKKIRDAQWKSWIKAKGFDLEPLVGTEKEKQG